MKGKSGIKVTQAETVRAAAAAAPISEGIFHRHFPHPAVDRLVGEGLSVLESVDRRRHDELARFADEEIVDPCIAQPDQGRIGAGLHDELVLEPASRSGEDQVDAGPEIRVDQPGKGRQSGSPLVGPALEVAEDGLGPVRPARRDIGKSALEIEPDREAFHCIVFTAKKNDRDSPGGEIEGPVRTLHVIGNILTVDLPLILDEVERKAAGSLPHGIVLTGSIPGACSTGNKRTELQNEDADKSCEHVLPPD